MPITRRGFIESAVVASLATGVDASNGNSKNDIQDAARADGSRAGKRPIMI